MAAALAQTRAAMGRLARSPGAQESGAALAAFESLNAVTVEHLDHEEDELEPVYLAKHDTAEIKAMGRAFGRVSPTTGGQFIAWVLDGASPDERDALTRDIPGPVISIVGGIFGRSYRNTIAPVWKS